MKSLVQTDPLFNRLILKQQVDLREPMNAKVIQRLPHTARPDQMSGGKDDQAVGLSPATISRILRSRRSPYDSEPTVPSNYCEVIDVARTKGESRFKVGWFSGPALKELNRTYVRPRRCLRHAASSSRTA